MTGATLPWIKTHAYTMDNFLANNTNKQQFISMLNAVVISRRGTVRPNIFQVMLIYLQKAVESANTAMTVLIGDDTVRHGFRIFLGGGGCSADCRILVHPESRSGSRECFYYSVQWEAGGETLLLV